MNRNKTGLGKGLSALIPPVSEEMNKDETAGEVKVSEIIPNTFQPRRVFDEEKLKELADSIKEHGVVQPIVVRKITNDQYELVVGERRLRACQKLRMSHIPALIKEYTDEQMMEIALIENIQRQDLNPVEEAAAYKRLLDEFGFTQEQVARKVAKSRSLVANMVRLLKLPQQVLDRLANGDLTIGHVRPLLALGDTMMQIKAAEEMLNKQLTVREAEALAQSLVCPTQKRVQQKKRGTKLPPELLDLESRLRDACGTKVTIKNKGAKGRIEIEYYNTDDLNRILSLIIQEELA